MPTKSHLGPDDDGKEFDQKVYRSMIGSLLYLCASRPDIMLSVCMCAQFQAAPKESHHLVVKRILRYLAYTPTLGLWYPKGSEFDIVGFSDADYAGDKVDRKSTSGTCHFLGRSLVCWYSKKQNCVSLYCWIWIQCCWILLCSPSLDEANSQRLWYPSEECASLLR